MDVHSVIVTAVEEVRHGVRSANAELAGKARVGEPTRIDIEFGITASYEVANYDDVRVATVRASIPILPEEVAGAQVGPASAAIENGAGSTGPKEKGEKADKANKKKK